MVGHTGILNVVEIMVKIIPRKEALCARLEELGLIWEDSETQRSLERRVARASVSAEPAFFRPPEADEHECFGSYYDESANECPHSGICELAEKCFTFTRMQIDDRIYNKEPVVREI